jgi:hypothetical protein
MFRQLINLASSLLPRISTSISAKIKIDVEGLNFVLGVGLVVRFGVDWEVVFSSWCRRYVNLIPLLQ